MPSERVMAQDLLQERANLISQTREILDAAEADGRGLNEEEEQRYDALMDNINGMTGRVERLQAQERMESELDEPLTIATRTEPNSERVTRFEFVSRGLRHAYDVDPGFVEQPEWQRLLRYAEPEPVAAFRGWLRDPQTDRPQMPARALQADSDTIGGYLITPIQMVDRMIQAVDNLTYLRQWATLYAVPNAESLGAVSLDNDPADPTWTSELAIGSEDSTMSFGKRELNPHPLAKYIKVSRKLLRKVPSVEDLVIGRLGYKFGVVMENAYLNGSGTEQPLGVFTASGDGISTGRDVSTGNTATEMRFDGLIEAKYTLKTQYWAAARWLFHRDGVKQIAKLKDSNGQYLWRESVRVGEPDRVLSFPVFMSEYAPNTFTTGLYVGILGNFSYYWIADALDMEFQRLVELYAATNQVGFIGRMESDGMPVLEEAFVRVQLA
jgi:HK97 family phage major capsid protein